MWRVAVSIYNHALTNGLTEAKAESAVETFCEAYVEVVKGYVCLLYTSPSPRDATLSRMPSSA